MLFSHPGRTMGAQVDTTIMAVTGIVLAILYSFAGLAASVSYNVNHDNYSVNPVGLTANAIFLVCGIFGAQLLRQMWPKFFFFSLHFMIVQIFTFTMGINELEIPYMLPVEYGIALIIGCGVSLVVNLLIWPETAMDGLGRALRDTMISSKDMLDMITKQFFLDPHVELLPFNTIDEAADKMRKNMSKMRTAYKEAKYEISYTRVRPQEMLNIRKSLERIAKHLSALSRSLHVERELFEGILASFQLDSEEEENDGEKTASEEEAQPRSSGSLRRMAFTKRTTSTGSLSDDDQHQRSVSSLKGFLSIPNLLSPQAQAVPSKRKKWINTDDRSLLFTYLESLRDPLTSLSVKCVDVLSCVCQSMSRKLDTEEADAPVFRNLFKKNRVAEEAKPDEKYHDPDHCTCADDMVQSLREFDAAEKSRIRALYNRNRNLSDEQAIDMNIREELFLVFFFIFTIREITKELEKMARDTEKLRKSHVRRLLYIPRPTLRWLRKWASWNNHQSTRDKGGYSHAALVQYTEEEPPNNAIHDEYRLANMHPRKRKRKNSAVPLNMTKSRTTNHSRRPPSSTSSSQNSRPSERTRRRSSTVLVDLENQLKFQSTGQKPDYDSESYARYQTTEPPLALRIRYSVWLFFKYMGKYEVKFAAKTAVAVTLLCIPAFVPDSADWYLQEKGQWAAVTVVAIMNPTSGGTLNASVWRIVGTVIGAFVGWAALETDDGSAYVLGFFAIVLAIPFFYIHLASTYNKVGIVVLITYVAVALTRYAQPVQGDTVTDTVWKRMLTVISGIIVAMILNTLVWPFIARHATRRSVSSIMSRLGEYYNFLVGTFLYHDPSVPPTESDITKGSKLESKIQASINATSVLLELTDHEPRLKGPFPKEIYHHMIDSCQAILDNLVSIRVALIQMPWIVKMDICSEQHYVLRRDMIASLMIHFYAISSSLASKVPLPPYLPSMRAARVRVINHRRNASNSQDRWVKFRNLSWYAMASCSEEIINELEHLTTLVRTILGETRYAERARNLDEKLISEDRY
ncbi:Fusaric acid resistance protein-like-domain-containing protein [Fennellomyces sp. T-0311]|nr:Fusaric acid resistance protein-like-domain-containing protein [Fennellomyces sp. T-0311]